MMPRELGQRRLLGDARMADEGKDPGQDGERGPDDRVRRRPMLYSVSGPASSSSLFWKVLSASLGLSSSKSADIIIIKDGRLKCRRGQRSSKKV
jgi:hypothetical protein